MAVFEILDWEKLISRKIWGPTRFGRIVPVAKVDNTENHFSEIHTHMTHIRTENNKLQKSYTIDLTVGNTVYLLPKMNLFHKSQYWHHVSEYLHSWTRGIWNRLESTYLSDDQCYQLYLFEYLKPAVEIALLDLKVNR